MRRTIWVGLGTASIAWGLPVAVAGAQALTNWRVGFPTAIDDREVQVVQGTTVGGGTATS